MHTIRFRLLGHHHAVASLCVRVRESRNWVNKFWTAAFFFFFFFNTGVCITQPSGQISAHYFGYLLIYESMDALRGISSTRVLTPLNIFFFSLICDKKI